MSEDPTERQPGDDLGRILNILDSLVTRFDSLEEKVERRLQETRPMWEQVLSRLDNVEAELGEVKTRLERVESELGAVKAQLKGVETRLEAVESGLYSLNRKFRVLYDDVLKMQDRDDDLEERLRKLEPEAAR